MVADSSLPCVGFTQPRGNDQAYPVSFEKIPLEGAVHYDNACAACNDGNVSLRNVRSVIFTIRPLCSAAFPDRIYKIHSPEKQCRQSLRWKMAGSSAAKATVRKANVTGKLFLIPPSPATRRSLPIPPTPDRS